MNYHFFGVPKEHRAFVRDRLAAMHHQRLAVVVPIMVVVCLFFVGVDRFLLKETDGNHLIGVYLGIDAGFLAVNAALAAYLFLGPRSTPVWLVYAYAIVGLAWAVVTAVIEFQRTENFTALLITVLAISVLGLFSAAGIASLILGALSAYLGLSLWWPGFSHPGIEENVSLFALAGVAFAISRNLYSAVINNLLSNHQLEQANAELREARLNLIRQEKLASVGVLSAGIAHEINNPLAFIKSNFAALERNHAGLQGDPTVLSENRAIFDETKEGFRRISEVVQALGAFGRELPAGERSAYDLNEGVRTTLVMTRHETAGSISIETWFGPVPTVPARGSEINQVLLNLLLNAFQAVRSLPPGTEPTVTIRTHADEQWVTVEISNNGPAIPVQFREKIFDPFFSTKAPGAGMGLGLSLSWHIAVRRHGGELELLEGEPVTFRLRLPLHPGPQSLTQSTK